MKCEKEQEFDEELDRLDKKFAKWIEAIRDSERLSAEDMTLRINAKDEPTSPSQAETSAKS